MVKRILSSSSSSSSSTTTRRTLLKKHPRGVSFRFRCSELPQEEEIDVSLLPPPATPVQEIVVECEDHFVTTDYNTQSSLLTKRCRLCVSSESTGNYTNFNSVITARTVPQKSKVRLAFNNKAIIFLEEQLTGARYIRRKAVKLTA